MKNVFEKAELIVKNSKDKGMSLLKKLGFGALVMSTIACTKDDDIEPTPAENQIPKVEATIETIDTSSASVLVKFHDIDGEVVSGTYFLTRNLPHGKVMGDTPLDSAQIAQGNDGGFVLDFNGLQSNSKHTLTIEAVMDNEGAEAKPFEIEFTTTAAPDMPEPVYTYNVNTDINDVISWDDVINGMVIPSGTVLGKVTSTKEVKKDGVIDNSINTNIKYEYTGEFSDDIEIQGNNIVNINPLLIDDENGETNVNVANGINLKVETTLEEEGESKAQDIDSDKVDILDGATFAPFDDSTGNEILVENNNGDLYQDYTESKTLFEGVTGLGTNINSGAMIQIANASNGKLYYENYLHTDGNYYPTLFFANGAHEGKALHQIKVQKMKHVLSDKLTENGITIDGISTNHNIYGMIISQLSDNDFEDFNGTSVKIKDSVIDEVCGTIIVKRLQEMGVTVQ